MSRAIVGIGRSGRHFEADANLHLFYSYHFYGVPGAAIQKGAVGALAGALFAADAEDRIHLDTAERQMIFIGHPVHAIGHRAIGHAGRRSGAARAAFGDDGKFLRPLLAWSSDSLGLRLHLDDGRGHGKSMTQPRGAGNLAGSRLQAALHRGDAEKTRETNISIETVSPLAIPVVIICDNSPTLQSSPRLSVSAVKWTFYPRNTPRLCRPLQLLSLLRASAVKWTFYPRNTHRLCHY